MRLTKGDFKTAKIYSASPLEVAKKFQQEGAKMLHIVDLDAAKTGKPVNQQLIVSTAKALNISVEVGGGIRNIETARQYLNSGIQRIIIGTKAITEPELVSGLIGEFGSDRIVVGVEIKNQKLATKGWQETSGKDYLDFAWELKALGVTDILFTDVDRDGTLTEPNFTAIKKLIKLGLKVTASGGISTLESIKKLADIGAFAAILGKALYENNIKLGEAAFSARPASNLAKRIIPCLDVKNGRVVKGVSFQNLRDAGEAAALGKKYSEEGADELVFLDITASKEKRQTMFEMVEKVAKEVFIPFTVGGGISTVAQARKLLLLGADKISINSSAIKNPGLITKAAKAFGNQCVVVAIDSKKVRGKDKVFTLGGSTQTALETVAWAIEAEKRGAGEILLTSMDKDGTRSGYDLGLLRHVSEAVNIPVIASGGAGVLTDLKLAFTEGKADAVLVASLFHYRQLTIEQAKKYLSSNNIPVRL